MAHPQPVPQLYRDQMAEVVANAFGGEWTVDNPKPGPENIAALFRLWGEHQPGDRDLDCASICLLLMNTASIPMENVRVDLENGTLQVDDGSRPGEA